MNLFPTPLIYGNLGRDLTESERKCIDELCTDMRGNGGANSITSNTYVLREPMLKQLNIKLTEIINQFLRNVFAPQGEFGLYITQSWINVTKPGQYHHRHRHPNSVLSGAFYIKTVQNDQIQVFSDIMSHPLMYAYDFTFKDQNMHNAWSYSQIVKDNDFVMFPSNLEHSVPTNKSNETRISLAFNTFLQGKVGNDIDLTELVLQ
tara:strand:+ start:439 stop:1053 length:615 start_codon:yes stop_codon:yes gene_type:complete